MYNGRLLDGFCPLCQVDEIERLRSEVEAWRECARYDPMMSGNAMFKGWDRSQMDRCRKKYIEGANV
jgi:hypothetical protein